MKRFLAITAAAMTGMVATPALAQDEAGDTVNMVIVYGDDDCPTPAEGEITVCARKAENERYRIPENLRVSDSPENVAWAERVERLEMVGAFGTLSCDPAGAGGVLGCTQRMIDAAYADKAEGSNVRFSQLIEAARAERLSTIDADAAAEQERVEQIEREYMERLERERQQALPGEASPPSLDAAAEPEASADDSDAPQGEDAVGPSEDE